MRTFQVAKQNGGSEPREVLHAESIQIGDAMQEFVVHDGIDDEHGLTVLSHYTTGMRITTVPDDETGFIAMVELWCKRYLEKLLAEKGAQQFNQAIQSHPVINPQQPQEIETMSLEQAIQANTAAIEKMIAALGAIGTLPAASAPATAEKPKTKSEPKAEKTPAAPAVDYDDVKAALGKVAMKARDQAVSLLQKYGATKAVDIKPDQYAAIVKDAEDILTGKAVPEDSLFE